MSKPRRKRVEDKMRPSRVDPSWDTRTRRCLSKYQKKTWKESDGVNLILAKYAKEMDGKLVRSPVQLTHAAERIREEINNALPPGQRHIKHKPILEMLMRGSKNPDFNRTRMKSGSRARTTKKLNTLKGKAALTKTTRRLELLLDSKEYFEPPKNVKERFGGDTTIGRILSMHPNSPFPLEDLLERSLNLGVSMSSQTKVKKKTKSRTTAAKISPQEKFAQHSLEEAIKAAKAAAESQQTLAESLSKISFFVGDHKHQSFDISKYLLQALGENYVPKEKTTLGTPMLCVPFQTNERATVDHIQKSLTEIPLVEHELESDAQDSTMLHKLIHPSLEFKPVTVQPIQYHPRASAADVSRGERPKSYSASTSTAFLFNYRQISGMHDELEEDHRNQELLDDRAASVTIGEDGLKITTDWNSRVGDDPGDRKAVKEALKLDERLKPSVSLKLDPHKSEPQIVREKPDFGVQDIDYGDD